MAQILVIGLGRFGFHVASLLHERGHEVVAVDIDEGNVQRIRDSCSRAIRLDARDKERLEALGPKHFDVAIVSLGERVDVSALVALHLKEQGVRRIITKAGSVDHAKLLEKLEVHEIVFPEREAAERLVRRLSNRNLLDFIPLGEGASIEEIAAPAAWVGRTLAELDLRRRHSVQVVGVRDALSDQVSLNPAADFRVLDSHSLIVLGANDDLARLQRL
jgi:trk system potassium uptake protein TrkA